MMSHRFLARPGVAFACFLALAALAAPCGAQKKGTTKRTLESGGVEREFLLHIPRRYKQASKKAQDDKKQRRAEYKATLVEMSRVLRTSGAPLQGPFSRSPRHSLRSATRP